MKKDANGVIILHGGGLGEYCLSFDVLVKSENADDYRWAEESLYKADCAYVKKFLEENKDFYYLGSGDFQGFCHEDYLRLLAKLLIDGFEVKCEWSKEVSKE